MTPPRRDPKDGFFDDPRPDEEAGTDEADLWFLPGPPDEEPDHLSPLPRADAPEGSVIDDWARAEAGHAAQLARVAGRLGALDDRLLRGPGGWRHRLALIEATELGWITGDRVSADRLALWQSMRVTGAQDDQTSLARIGWAARRLAGGPGPIPGLADFLDRRDPENADGTAEPLEDRAGGWQELMAAAAGRLHPITRACMGFHLWSLAGLGTLDDRAEAGVVAARLAAGEGGGAVFAPVAMGGAAGLRASGPADERLARWLDGMASGTLAAMRQLDAIERWTARAERQTEPLSGRTPALLMAVLTEWPLVSAPMAERLTGASRATVQRNLAWMEERSLIREVTGQGRFRMWRIAI